MRRSPTLTALALVSLAALAACQGTTRQLPSDDPSTLGGARTTAGATPTFVGFWESWSDRSQDPFHLLQSVPKAVTDVDVAFSLADGNAISDPQNSRPLLPGIRAIHRHGGKVLLSFGGSTSTFGITDVTQFENNLAAYFKAHQHYYDGVDFDDENINAGTAQLLSAVINATRAKFPTLIISFDAFMSGVDPSNPFEAGVLQNAGQALSYVNVMDYDQYGWKPTDHPNCKFQTGYGDDCYLDVVEDFANVQTPSGPFGSAKVVMGLMIGPADDGAVITPPDAQSYAQWVKANEYAGVMIWDVDRDGPATTKHPKGDYISTIGAALGT